ncbi:hypothetical protein SDC9_24498 [bioreactor metagenome]|mgnify:CR=1 FL=1|jgi:hypothetical protein|uniref:Porin domain-containing protein n=1 Tax=bioreactor metagenome TaxID=1076179 RepID=A0A644UI01_9ZZZZ|nr:exported hypothetical protein [uncultured Spirochaetota bacterium]
MKKLIVLLLALAMVGAVSAQVTTAVGLYGEITLVDEAGQGVFTPWGNGYDTLTLKAQDKDGKYGFSLTDQNLLDGSFDTLRDWTVWGKVLGGKLSAGLLRDATFRLTLPYWPSYTIFGGTDRVAGQGVFYVYGPKEGLSLGVNLPYGLVAEDTLDVLQKADLGVKYDIKDVGTVFALMDMNFVTPANVLNAGFKFTGVKSLTATAITKLQFDADIYRFALGASYTGIENLAAYFEGAFVSTAGVATYSIWAQGDYTVIDPVTVSLGAYVGDNSKYDVYGLVAYDLGAGMTAEASLGYDSALWAAAKLYYVVSL